MDNLFNSRKLFTALYLAKALAHGVVCTHGRGLPPRVLQTEEKNGKRAEVLQGTTKAARLINCPECPNLTAAPVYDTKPVHMVSTTARDIKWMEKRRRVWSVAEHALIYVIFLRLNLIDDHNNKMNSTDIYDQLRNQYHPDHRMRIRKWWWAFFIWAIGVAAANAWKMYDVMYERQKKRSHGNLPPKWTHKQFLEQLVYDLLSPKDCEDHISTLRSMGDGKYHVSVRSAKALSVFSGRSSRLDGDEE